MKKYILTVFVLFILFPFFQIHASVSISEVMYDLQDTSDSDHEWIELYNDGSDAVSLTGWKFSDGSNHNLNIPPQNGGQGSISIDPKEYVILSGNATTFLSDHPGFSGTVIDTVMSLNNVSATLNIIDNSGTNIDSIGYTNSIGANGDGNTLIRLNEQTLVSGSPTPGYENIESNDSNTKQAASENSNPGSSTTSSGGLETEQHILNLETVKEKIFPVSVKIHSLNKSFANVPHNLFAQATGEHKEILYGGKFVWSFGDGFIRTEENSAEFSHVYEYSGEYVVYLEYYRYSYSKKPDAIDKLIIKVLPATLAITNTYPDGSVELTNQGGQEIDLIGWKIGNEISTHSFVNHLIILPKDKIRISRSILQLSDNAGSPILYDPSGNIVSSVSQEKIKVSRNKNESVIATKAPSLNETGYKNNSPSNQTATSLNSIQLSNNSFSRTTLILAGFVLLMFIVLGSIVYLWNRKSTVSSIEETASGYFVEEMN